MSYKIYHLSHTDLDGYGCQMVTNHFFKNIEFLNSNYGKEIVNSVSTQLTKEFEQKLHKVVVNAKLKYQEKK